MDRPRRRPTAHMKLVQHPRWQQALAIKYTTHEPEYVRALRVRIPEDRREHAADEGAWFFDTDFLADALEVSESYYALCWNMHVLRDHESLPIPADTEYPTFVFDPDWLLALDLPEDHYPSRRELRAAMGKVKAQFQAEEIPRDAYVRAREAFDELYPDADE
jgi:hypothetical protein